MASFFGRRTSQPQPSPLEGLPDFRAQQVETGLRQLGRRERWLWISAFSVTVLSATALIFSSFPVVFRRNQHFYDIRPDQARW